LFWEDHLEFLPQVDRDGDGYYRTAYLQWDADTYDDSALVKVLCYGRDSTANEHLIFEFGPYWIWGFQTDILAANHSVPYQNLWSFRLVLTDEFGDSLAGYAGDATMTDIPMESKLEDLQYMILQSSPEMYNFMDDDADGYPQIKTMEWHTLVEEYDTTDNLALTLKIYGRDTAGVEIYLGRIGPFYVEPGEEEGWYTQTVAGHHGLWDFRLELMDIFGGIGATYAYGMDGDLTDVPMELWIEDPPVTAVFNPNPVNTLNDETLRDENDWMYAVPATAYRLVFLEDLAMPFGGYYHLIGPYVRVVQDLGPPSTNPALAPEASGPNFPYYRSDDEFEEVMCYYHIDRCQRYVQSLGFEYACNRQIEVDAHGRADTTGGAYYANANGTGDIRLGDGGVDGGEDADVILHEYGHAIMDNQAPQIYWLGNGSRGYGNETGYMKEGFAFYWDATMNDSMSIANGWPSTCLGEWIAQGIIPEALCYYDIENPVTYPNEFLDTIDAHWYGEVWGGALWDIREALGRRIADSLILYSHELVYYHGITNPTFKDGAMQILEADDSTHNGAHSDTLCSLFLYYGFYDCVYCGLDGDMNNDGSVDPLDVTLLANKVYYQLDNLYDYYGLHGCPWPNGDVDCSTGAPDPVDVTLLVKKVYQQLDALCDRCAA
jgi:hypothetical protein